jgi:hypothetical protein
LQRPVKFELESSSGYGKGAVATAAVMTWPSPQEYNEAVQTPATSFSDGELRLAEPECNNLGLPKANSGAFASVYRMVCKGKHLAVRCFLRDVADQNERYESLTRFVMSDDLPYTVDFTYLREGIKIRGQWFPLLKMAWVSGTTLDVYVLQNLSNPSKIVELADKFVKMCEDLRASGVAHGDLQHGNVMVTPDEQLRLVDYDGMFVPALKNWRSNELGHPNYQHPLRNADDFNIDLDNFSAWVIDCSLRILSLDPILAKQLNCGDDALLFRRRDYIDPLHSPAFLVLENHSNEQIQTYARWIRTQVYGSIASVPPRSHLSQINPASLPAVQIPNSLSVVSKAKDVSWDELRRYYELDRPSQMVLAEAEIVWVRHPDYDPATFARACLDGSGGIYDPSQFTALGYGSEVVAPNVVFLLGLFAFIFCLTNISLYPFAFFIFVIGIMFYSANDLRRERQLTFKQAQSAVSQEPVEATLRFFLQNGKLYCQIWSIYGEAGRQRFTLDLSSRVFEIHDLEGFEKRYQHLIDRRYRCFLFLNPDDAPVAMVDNVGFFWLL